MGSMRAKTPEGGSGMACCLCERQRGRNRKRGEEERGGRRGKRRAGDLGSKRDGTVPVEVGM